jgi:hypothetical protein
MKFFRWETGRPVRFERVLEYEDIVELKHLLDIKVDDLLDTKIGAESDMRRLEWLSDRVVHFKTLRAKLDRSGGGFEGLGRMVVVRNSQ